MRDSPPEVINPTTILAVWALIGFVLGRFLPIDFLSDPLQRVLELLTVGSGFVILLWSMLEMRRHGTSPDHSKPTSALVTTGPFRYSRNPIYVGLILLMIGFSVAYESLWSLALIGPTVVAMHNLTVLREEASLDRDFGEDYRRYRASVRRWL